MLVILVGCNVPDEVQALDANVGPKKVWIFVQFNVPEEGDQIETYYYYAKISERLLDRISTNAIESGFILMEDVRYWGDGDLLYAYRDIESSGELIFRIEDIAKLEPIRVEPKVGLGYEQFDEPAVEAQVEMNLEADPAAAATTANEAEAASNTAADTAQ